MSTEEIEGLLDATGAAPGDLVLIVADERPLVRHVLGLLRLELGRPPVNEGGLHFLWVVEFPAFARSESTGEIDAESHPFTGLFPDDLDLLETDPLSVRARHYDLVMNGEELGSGSIRISDPDLQRRALAVLGTDADEARRRFGHLLTAFEYGVPPHGGFAVGLDRLYMLMTGESAIREVIAFPKTQQGYEPMTGAPAPVDDAQLRELGLRVVQPPS